MRDQVLQAAPNGVYTLEVVRPYGITRAACLAANIPSGATGFKYGCQLHILDNLTEATELYINTGSVTSCTFTAFDYNVAEAALLTGLLATSAEINRNNKPSTRLVASGANLTVTQALHDGKTIVLAAAAAITLPAMTGSGSRFMFVCGVAATTVTITATGAHLYGSIPVNTDSAFAAGTLFTVGAAVSAGSTIITLDGSTRGGHIGDWIEIEDVATSVGRVRGSLNGSGTEATPYS